MASEDGTCTALATAILPVDAASKARPPVTIKCCLEDVREVSELFTGGDPAPQPRRLAVVSKMLAHATLCDAVRRSSSPCEANGLARLGSRPSCHGSRTALGHVILQTLPPHTQDTNADSAFSKTLRQIIQN